VRSSSPSAEQVLPLPHAMRADSDARLSVDMSALRAKLPSLSLGAWSALAFAGIAAFAVLMWWLADALDDWAPNFAAEALSIAATLVIVERIVRHEARQRLMPRIESAMAALRSEFRRFLQSVTVDYAGTHLHTFRPLPRDAPDFLDQWLADKQTQDACFSPRRVSDDPKELPLVLGAGEELGKALSHYRELDRDVLDAEVVRAIDDYLWMGVQWAGTRYHLADRGGGTVAEAHASAETTIVRQARALGGVIARHDPHGRIEFQDLTLTAMQEHSEHLRQRAGEIAGYRWYPKPMQPDE
jgi:hypothetical protein